MANFTGVGAKLLIKWGSFARVQSFWGDLLDIELTCVQLSKAQLDFSLTWGRILINRGTV